ncbi:MAG: hypothetical protein EBU80_10330, partial [Chitinophagia bacterium]|nr:hypothetical protein [Chitinophagia bacterium]
KSKSLDIGFTNNKINYRITIDDSNMEEYASKNKITPQMIKEFLVKQTIKGIKPIDIKELNLRINMKEEKQVTDEALIKKLLASLSKSNKSYRYKTIYSFISKNGLFRYDFTEVNKYRNANPAEEKSNKTFSVSDILKDEIDYELEIEIIDRNKITNTGKIATDFFNEGSDLHRIVIDMIEQKSRKSSSISSSTDISSLSDQSIDSESISNMNWVLPNRIGYGENVFKNFRPENYQPTSKLSCVCDGNICDVSTNSVNLYPQQRLIKDYVQYDSPYRGALLYHELGSGKSGASIAAAEGYINKKKMFVLSPASLAVNYEMEILKISSIGLNLKKDWKLVQVNKSDATVTDLLLKKYAINAKDAIKKDGLVWIPLYDDDIPNAIVIKTVANDTDKPLIDAMISHIIRNRYTFISYNGLNQKLIESKLGGKTTNRFNNSFVIIDEVHNFASRIVNGSKLAREVFRKLMDAQDCKLILLSGTPIINNPYEIATIINLIRGTMTVYEFPLKNMTEDEIKKRLITSDLMSLIDEYYIDHEKNNLLLSLLPKNYKKTESDSIMIQKQKWTRDENQILSDIITVLELDNKSPNKHQLSALPSSIDEFNNYFLDMTDDEDPKIKNQDLFMRRILGTVSYYSISGSDLFPKRNDDVLQILDMTDNQFKKYAEARDIERKMEMKKGNVLDNKTSVYRAFSRMVCNFSFPENIDRVYPNDIKKELKKEIDEDDDEKEMREKRLGIKENTTVDLYQVKLNDAINELKDGNYLTFDKVKKQLSPKFAQMYIDIKESPGSVLVYSQFRTVEGLGLFSEFLNKNGFIEVDFKKIDGQYYLTNPNVFNRMYDNKRYIIFSSDKEKTRYLMNLFNGDFENLPPKIVEALPRDRNQLYGKLVKVFCITASGAEGLSLKNVRRVLIAEPYWNNIRTDQVIGRAIRSCSHEKLPLNDRNVTVYRYIMKITKKQLSKNFTLESLDKGISTDEHIAMMATKKMNLVNQFLQMLKASSFDCIINSHQNKPLKNGYKCYNWALGVNNKDLSYTYDIKDDHRIMKHKATQILKKNKGKVLIKNGIKYVIMNGKIY